jgi:hypothetical protein
MRTGDVCIARPSRISPLKTCPPLALISLQFDTQKEGSKTPGGVCAKYKCMYHVIPAGKYASRFECLICQHGWLFTQHTNTYLLLAETERKTNWSTRRKSSAAILMLSVALHEGIYGTEASSTMAHLEKDERMVRRGRAKFGESDE